MSCLSRNRWGFLWDLGWIAHLLRTELRCWRKEGGRRKVSQTRKYSFSEGRTARAFLCEVFHPTERSSCSLCLCRRNEVCLRRTIHRCSTTGMHMHHLVLVVRLRYYYLALCDTPVDSVRHASFGQKFLQISCLLAHGCAAAVTSHSRGPRDS